jgi:hypothetical protein
MSQLRILSYLPNPRTWKATIVARLVGVDLDLRGASPKELQSWLWDFDARPLSADDTSEVRGHAGFQGKLRETTIFREAHRFGTVPAAFSRDGKVGIIESNSSMRAVARLADDKLGPYGKDPYKSSRIDSFLDASLVFARDSQILSARSGRRSLVRGNLPSNPRSIRGLHGRDQLRTFGRSRVHRRRLPDPGRRMLRR